MMQETRLTHLKIPLTIAESIHLVDATAAPLKLMLIAESEREERADHVSIPVGRVRSMAAWTGKTLHGAIRGVASIRSRWSTNPDDPQALMPETWSPFREAPRAEFDGEDERVVACFSPEWLTACRGPRIAVPLDDLRDLRLRAAILVRLRLEAALHGHETVRVRWPMADLAMLSGRGGDYAPAAHLLPDVALGVRELCAVSSSMSVDVKILTSRSGRAVDPSDPSLVTREGRTRGVVLTARRLRPRRVGKGAKVANEAHALDPA